MHQPGARLLRFKPWPLLLAILAAIGGCTTGFELQDTAIFGKVTENGEGLGGATVRIEKPSGTDEAQVTAADGSYQFSNLAEGDHTVSATAEGLDCDPSQTRTIVPTSKTEGVHEVNFDCRRLPGRIEGKVTVNGAGTQATVDLFQDDLVGPNIGTVQTDGSGSFAFADVSPGSFGVVASKPNHDCGTKEVTVVSEQTTQADLACTPRPATVVVTVLLGPGGTPLSGVQVAINGPTNPSGTIGADETVNLTQTGTTGPDGKVTFPGLPPGTYDITAQQGSLSCPSTTVTVGPNEQGNATIVCTPPTTATIHVDVRRQDGTPVVGMSVTLTLGPPAVVQSTNASGRASFTNVTPGNYTIRFAGTSFGLTCADLPASVGPGSVLTVSRTCTSP